MKSQKFEFESAISVVKSNLDEHSELRPSSRSNSNANVTLTSNFTMETVDVDYLKQQLAASTFELEEQKIELRKQMMK